MVSSSAPDGSVTKALQGLTALAEAMRDNSGVDTSAFGWMDSVFGKWKLMISSVLISLITATSLLAVCGCCCIPCIRGLSIKLIETGMTRVMVAKDVPWEEGGSLLDDLADMEESNF
ncbi:hypothetical protein DPEC_G00343050 [Dallia pectoralis]|uniref:Uncharacterized protein n=1 Tax=Dallia pectoralis TaxID=75939 RepID=A0ACC2F2P4_DALPE|nr:hypothetical protein DPEC_G00343050 [Dallia pectoralis]